jgi:uncharacterized membrane protein
MAEERQEQQKEEVKKAAPQAAPKPAAKPVSGDKVVEEGKGMAWLSYIGILFLVPLLAKKDNAFCMHHAKQGLVYFIIEFCLAILLVIPFLGWIIYVLGMLFMLVMSIIGLVQSLQGNYWEAPIGIYKLSQKFKF